MSKKRRTFSAEFKTKVVLELLEDNGDRLLYRTFQTDIQAQNHHARGVDEGAVMSSMPSRRASV